MSDFPTPFNLMSYGELRAEMDRRRALHPSNPNHPDMFRFDSDRLCWVIYWGGYEYDLDDEGIVGPHDVISAAVHVGKKAWEHATNVRLARLIQAMMDRHGWSIYRPFPHPNEAPSAFIDPESERAKMTPSMRYDVICRDGYRCRACGFSVSDGARLHVDHIHPVSKGGRTEKRNLQTLCSACNIGKGAAVK